MILEKQVNDSLKFEAVKVSKEVANSKKRDQAIQEMIEKERVQEVVFLIKKSPQSKVATELLKEFKIMPEKKLIEDDSN
jgi:hypothetical protein